MKPKRLVGFMRVLCAVTDNLPMQMPRTPF